MATSEQRDAAQRNGHFHGQTTLNELGEKIFLDRYALKDMTKRSLAAGDTVIVCVNQKTRQREIGRVLSIQKGRVTVELRDGSVTEQGIEDVDKPLETDPGQMMDRVARGIAAVETDPLKRVEWEREFRWLLDSWKFVPGGRILTAAGTEQQLTFYNCYVVPSPKDSRKGIVETLSQMMEIMSRGGGVGINLSSLRPQHAYVKGVNGRSSGSVSWGGLYSFVTGLIEQGGCFGPHERIATDRGLIPARELADRLDAGETIRAQTHKGLRDFTAVFRNGVKPLFEVKTKRGNRVRVTADHKIAVLRGGAITTVALRDLAVGDEVLLLLGEGVDAPYVKLAESTYTPSIMSTRLNSNVRFPAELTEDLAYLVGYAHGDGYVHIGKKVTWSAPKALKLATADTYPEIRQRLRDIPQQLFDLQTTLEDCAGSAHANIGIYSRGLVEWLTGNGLLKAKAEAIRVPEAIFRSPSSVMAAFVAGYFDADGCDRGRKGGYGIDSISRSMLEDVQQLLAINGIASHISTRDRSREGYRTIYRLSVTGAEFKARLSEWMQSAKDRHTEGRRNHFNSYPIDSWRALGIPGKYYQGIFDSTKERVSYRALSRIQGRLADEGRVELAGRLGELLHTLPDTIVDIEPLGDSDVYDFEVDDVHLLSGGGVYTSNSRRGALMLILNVWHPDVFNFINSKREAGKITNANISVGLTDAFMEAVEKDADWDLVFPDPQAPGYEEDWDGDIDAWRRSGRPVNMFKTVRARELWNQLIESAWASAEPGLWFIDRSNKMSNSHYFSRLISTNPCHSGRNLVHTRSGLLPIKDLAGKEFEVISDLRTLGGEGVHYEWAQAYPTGVKQLFKVTLDTGHSIELTENHRVFTQRGKVEVKDLQIDEDELWLQSAPHLDALAAVEDDELRTGRILGWNAGDGWISQWSETRTGSGINVGFIFNQQEEMARDYVLDFVHERSSSTRVVNPRLNQGCWEIQSSNQALVDFFGRYGFTPKRRKQVTTEIASAPISVRIGFLQGLFSADGSVDSYRTDRGSNAVILVTSYKGLAYGVQLLLADLGIKAYVRTRQAKGVSYVTKDGEHRTSNFRNCYAVRIGSEAVHRFHRLIGFPMSPQKQGRLEETIKVLQAGKQFKTTPFSRVVSIEPLGEETVYNVTTDVSHTLVVNGMVVANCGEQPLPAFGICNLGAINLGKFVKDKRVEWDELRRAVRAGVRFLDNVIDSTPYFFEENLKQQQRERRVGLGIMGLAEMLVRLEIRYGSDECLHFLDELGEAIASEAYYASADYAAEKGAFPEFDAEQLLQSGYMQAMPEPVREAVRAKGLRNVTLLTVAPTGTTGTMVNTSTGVEPYFSWSFFRKSRLGVHEEKVAVVEEWQQANPGKPLPDFFVNAMELTPIEHVNVQGALQRWVDSAISKTCNVPNEYTVDQTRELYERMYRLGCKGGTIYRDGSRDEQVLNLKKEEPKAAAAPAAEAAAAEAEAPRKAQADMWNQPKIRPRPKRTRGTTIKQRSPLGAIYVTINDDDNGEPLEVFITTGKAGSDVTSMADGMGRLMSILLRVASPVTPSERLREVIDQLKGIGGSRSTGFGKDRVRSLPDAVAMALEECISPPAELAAEEAGVEQAALPFAAPSIKPDLCPECGEASFVHEEGCMHCNSCGFSQC